MTPQQPTPEESDSRFPSGPWVGFFMYAGLPVKCPMELRLSFGGGIMSGEGRDMVGNFTIQGHYNVIDGACHWTKQYLGRHSVYYRGFNEGKGIWGAWEINYKGMTGKGGFHIWPEGLPDPTQPVLHEEVDLPNEVETLEKEPVLV